MASMSKAEEDALVTHARAADVMSTNVVAVRERTLYKQLVTELLGRRVSAFPVLDDEDKVVGVVSTADLLAKEALAGTGKPRHPWLSGPRRRRELAKAAGLTAADLMTAPALTVGPDCPVPRAARLMSARCVKRLPVVDAEGRLLGIISRSDTLSVFRRPDEDIRQAVIRDVIADGFFVNPAAFTVSVTDGVVTLEGAASTAAISHSIAEQVRHLEGVVAVRERTARPEA